MLTADLSVTDNGTPTNIGALGAKTYALVANPTSGATKRRIAATVNSTPQELSVSHTVSGSGFKQRVRTLVRQDYRDIATGYATEGVVPAVSAYIVIDRPLFSDGAITDAIVMNSIGAVIGAVLGSGNIAKLLNQEA